MAIFYSAARRGFFDDAVHTDLPVDAVKVSKARHRQLLEAQDQGAQIVPGSNGSPVLLHLSPAPDLRARMVRRIKRIAARRITAISPAWRQLNDLRQMSLAAADRFAAIDAIRAASNLIEQDLAATADTALANFPLQDHPLWPTTQEA